MIGICFVSEKVRKIKSILALIVVAFVTWRSTSLGIQYIDTVHVNGKPDVKIAEHILSNKPCDIVYMIDDGYRITGIYSRMQVLIKDIPLKIIYKEELEQIDRIPSGSWVLTYADTPMRDTYLLDLHTVMKGDVFELWEK